jgi:glycosyltransferase involved in cell wall biosynthesis
MKSEETQIKRPRLEKPVRITEQIWPEGMVPVVSVFSWTYNHAQFIRESIESILMQETTFPVEIIIHDDASNDGTAEIIREYEKKYPQLFRNILNRENKMSKGDSVMCPLFEKPLGVFIALTHGDDYWTDEFKLLKQIEYLENKNDFTGVFHRGYATDEKRNRIPFVWDKIKYQSFNTQEDCIFTLLSGYPTAALVFRKKAYPSPRCFPVYFKKEPSDFCLDIMITENGKLGFLDFEGSAYRQHAGGIWSSLSRSEMHRQRLARYAALYEDKNLRQKYPKLKTRVLRLMDVQWWLYFEGGLKSWLSSSLLIIQQIWSCDTSLVIQWLLRKESPVRFKLRDILIGNHAQKSSPSD